MKAAQVHACVYLYRLLCWALMETGAEKQTHSVSTRM